MSKVTDKMFDRRANKLQKTLKKCLEMLDLLNRDRNDLHLAASLCEKTMQARRDASDLNLVVFRIHDERPAMAKGGR